MYPQGKMSQHIDGLKIGDTLDIKVCGCISSAGSVGVRGWVWGCKW